MHTRRGTTCPPIRPWPVPRPSPSLRCASCPCTPWPTARACSTSKRSRRSASPTPASTPAASCTPPSRPTRTASGPSWSWPTRRWAWSARSTRSAAATASLVPYEHKRGRARRDGKTAEPWPSDRLQVVAYAVLIESATGQAIPEGRVRYHADNVTVRVPIDEAARADLAAAIADGPAAPRVDRAAARSPRTSGSASAARSPRSACPRRSGRRRSPAASRSGSSRPTATAPASTSSPRAPASAARGETLVVTPPDGEPPTKHAIREVDALLLHGYAQVTTQALALCAERGGPRPLADDLGPPHRQPDRHRRPGPATAPAVPRPGRRGHLPPPGPGAGPGQGRGPAPLPAPRLARRRRGPRRDAPRPGPAPLGPGPDRRRPPTATRSAAWRARPPSATSAAWPGSWAPRSPRPSATPPAAAGRRWTASTPCWASATACSTRPSCGRSWPPAWSRPWASSTRRAAPPTRWCWT